MRIIIRAQGNHFTPAAHARAAWVRIVLSCGIANSKIKFRAKCPLFIEPVIFHLCIVARAGFVEPLYNINETVGSQEICVQVFNPPQDLPLTIYIVLIASTTTVNSTAGITITQDIF